MALLNAGLPLPGSRKTKSKAETELLGLVADGSNSEPASKRRRTSVNYADHTTRTGAYKAGLGRGKTTYEAVEEGELVQPSTAQLLLLQPKSKTERNLQAALRNEIVEHKGTKRKLHSATQELSFAQALLLEEHSWGKDSDADELRRQAIHKVIGCEFDVSTSKFRGIRLAVETYIRDKVGAHGVLGEMQLCECILKGLKKSHDKSIFPSQTSKEKQRSARRKEANEAQQQQRSELETLLVDSVKAYLTGLKSDRKTRPTHSARVTEQVLLDALVFDAPSDCLKLISEFINIDNHRVQEAKKRSDAMQEARKQNQTPLYYQDKEASCNAFDKEWVAFIEQGWKMHSRESEKKATKLDLL